MRDEARGVLAIWNDIDEDAEAEFQNWHVREHMPERVGLPGFLRGQRYVAVEASPKYFNFYEAVDAATFSSPHYRARLNEPTPWTRKVVAHFRNTSRTICRRVAHAGRGDGAFAETLRLSAADEDRFSSGALRLLSGLVNAEGIVAATLLQGLRDASAGASAEKTLRAGSDEIAEWVLITEAVTASSLTDADHVRTLETALLQAGAKPGWKRGIYQLQFSLTRSTESK